MPKITVLIPAYNAQEHLSEAIQSILDQTYRDYEILLINDGSTDNSEKIMEEFKSRDNKIRVLNKPNSGIIDSLNLGIDNSDSEYIARMDADDISVPVRLERQNSILDSSRKLIVCGSAVMNFGSLNKKTTYPETDKACKDLLLLTPCFAHPAVIMRRSALAEGNIRYQKGYEYAEDFKMWSDLSTLGSYINTKEILLRYRIHGTQTSMLKLEAQKKTHVKICQENLGKKNISVEDQDIYNLLWQNSSFPSSTLSTINIYRAIQPRSLELNTFFAKKIAKSFGLNPHH